MPESVALRRELGAGERLVRCTRCGHVEIPLNSTELWHYCRTGEGLLGNCQKHMQGWHKWEHVAPDGDDLDTVSHG